MSPPDDDSQSNSGMPDDIPPPPLPKPDVVDPTQAGPSYGKQEQPKKQRKKDKRAMSHPTDLHHAQRKQKRGCKGCCGCIGGITVVLVLIFAALAGVALYSGPARYLLDDYQVVTMEETSATIDEAPAEPTFYIGQNIRYEASETTVPIAIVGAEIEITGDFLENVSLTALKVTGESDARFAENLEIFAAEFLDEGITLTGELKGRVMRNLP